MDVSISIHLASSDRRVDAILRRLADVFREQIPEQPPGAESSSFRQRERAWLEAFETAGTQGLSEVEASALNRRIFPAPHAATVLYRRDRGYLRWDPATARYVITPVGHERLAELRSS
jgi:hypothetical protein